MRFGVKQIWGAPPAPRIADLFSEEEKKKKKKANRISLVSRAAGAEGLACADLRAKTPIGGSLNSPYLTMVKKGQKCI
jgi:hypothetical protein